MMKMDLFVDRIPNNISHYTSYDVLSIILKNHTFKLNNLFQVNDDEERQRRGIEDEAKRVFVACFNMDSDENHEMWCRYGKSNFPILIKINNFSSKYQNIFRYDYLFDDRGRKIIINSDLYSINNANHVEKVQYIRLCQVEYLAENSEVFNKTYGYKGSKVLKQGVSVNTSVKKYEILGKTKRARNWKVENEIRYIFNSWTANEYYYSNSMFMRLTIDFFKDMEIIIPKDKNVKDVMKLIAETDLPFDIKDSIIVRNSQFLVINNK